MISFENYPKGGDNNFRTLIYIILGVVGAVVLYKLYMSWAYPLIDVTTIQKLYPKQSGQVKQTGDGYGYDASDDWKFSHSAMVGVDGIEGRDPSNSVQQYTKVVSDIDGKEYWEPVVKNMTQDYLTEDEFDFIVDRHVTGYSEARLRNLTLPSYIKNADHFWGLNWPGEPGEPLSNMRGACVNEEDIIGREGIFNSKKTWGQHNEKDTLCMY